MATRKTSKKSELAQAGEHLSTAADGLIECQVFKGMEGIMVNEDVDRPLCGEQVGSMFDRLPEPDEGVGGQFEGLLRAKCVHRLSARDERVPEKRGG